MAQVPWNKGKGPRHADNGPKKSAWCPHRWPLLGDAVKTLKATEGEKGDHNAHALLRCCQQRLNAVCCVNRF